MKHQGNYYLCTIKELANMLATIVDKGRPNGRSWFSDYVPTQSFKQYFTFSQLNSYNIDNMDDLECVASGAEGWYGIKAIDTGFESNDLDFACDYYGGGCLSTGTVYDGLDVESMAQVFITMISKTLSYMEGCDIEKSLLIVESGGQE